jgi:hypothetical protein
MTSRSDPPVEAAQTSEGRRCWLVRQRLDVVLAREGSV